MFVEVVFAYPGMGTLIYEAGAARDYPLLQGAFLVTMIFVLALNLLADALYGLLDPRIRRAGA
jgi:peptide/nickel transport system permease protein